ncbi:hypothetical protein PI125_g16002 [Phytophthora idaei]|nr:hypothetical protein PI125_g16002 [Phytophthora idaei]
MPTSDVKLLLESLKAKKVTHVAPTTMLRPRDANSTHRLQLPGVRGHAPCPRRGKTLSCQHLNLVRVEESGAHAAPSTSPQQPRLTAAM